MDNGRANSLYLKGGELRYVYNRLGKSEQKLVSDRPFPTGKHILGVRFEVEAKDGPAPDHRGRMGYLPALPRTEASSLDHLALAQVGGRSRAALDVATRAPVDLRLTRVRGPCQVGL